MTGDTELQLHRNDELKKTRLLASQACDACRVRKVRCDMSSTAQKLTGNDLAVPDRQTFRDKIQCRRCAHLAINCTFLLPTKVRGPRKRMTSSDVTISDREPNLSPTLPAQSTDVTDSLHVTLLQRSISQTESVSYNTHSPYGVMETSLQPGAFDRDTTVIGERPTSQARQSITSPNSIQSHISPQDFFDDGYPTDRLCHRQLLKRMVNDYLDHLYPLIPIVHRPTLSRNLAQSRDKYDKHFLSLLFALCAITVGILPRKFRDYQCLTSPISFHNRKEMIDFCYKSSDKLRGDRYFDEINYTKWAVSYLFSLAYFQIGETNLARMIEVESMQFARLLELHRISAYSGLNYVEQQLRKKAFWLMFYAYVHSQFQSLRKEKLTYIDCSMLHDIDLDNLLPHPNDDESITEVEIEDTQAPPSILTSGFILHSKLFWAAVTSISPDDRRFHKGACHCVRSREPTLYLEHLQHRLQELKYMLDAAPWYYRQWLPETTDSDLFASHGSAARDLLRAQVNTMRANIHVTHLWLQSIITDQIDLLSMARLSSVLSPAILSPMSSIPGLPPNDPKGAWHRREDLCRQLLHILFSIPESSLEANGLHLIYKVRDVAVSLLACPFEEGGTAHDNAVARRAKEYLKDFADRLSRLDKSEVVNSISLQSWIDTDRVDLIHDWW